MCEEQTEMSRFSASNVVQLVEKVRSFQKKSIDLLWKTSLNDSFTNNIGLSCFNRVAPINNSLKGKSIAY